MTKKIFVHDRLVHMGWAEMILQDLIRKNANKDSLIFTLFSSKKQFDWLPVITVFPKLVNNRFISWSTSNRKIVRRLVDYRNMMPFYPLLVWILRKKIKTHSPETLIVSSFAAVKNINSLRLASKESILYCHSPMQYIRENYDEYCKKLGTFKKMVFVICAKYLRIRDSRKNTYDIVYANSYYTKSCIEKRYWWDHIQVWYPSLPEEILNTPALEKPYTYYLFVWRVVKFVRELDKIITMCNTLHLPLIVMWSWPDEIELKELAWETITFIGHISDTSEKIKIIKQATWFINLAQESCGIWTMEALSLWVPVLWYNKWWTKELIFDENLWTLVETKEIESLIDALQAFHQREFDRKNIKKMFLTFYKENNVGEK